MVRCADSKAWVTNAKRCSRSVRCAASSGASLSLAGGSARSSSFAFDAMSASSCCRRPRSISRLMTSERSRLVSARSPAKARVRRRSLSGCASSEAEKFAMAATPSSAVMRRGAIRSTSPATFGSARQSPAPSRGGVVQNAPTPERRHQPLLAGPVLGVRRCGAGSAGQRGQKQRRSGALKERSHFASEHLLSG